MLEKGKGSQVQTKSVVCEKGRGIIGRSRIIIRRRRRRRKKKKKKEEEKEEEKEKLSSVLASLRFYDTGVSKENCVGLQQKSDSVLSSKSRTFDKNV